MNQLLIKYETSGLDVIDFLFRKNFNKKIKIIWHNN